MESVLHYNPEKPSSIYNPLIGILFLKFKKKEAIFKSLNCSRLFFCMGNMKMLISPYASSGILKGPYK
jgi:hypothetical protein